MSRSSWLYLLLTLAVVATMHAETTPRESLLVLSKGDHTLAIVDPATLKVVAKAPVGDDPHEVVASADGHVAYVSNYGFGAFDSLAVIDLVGQKASSSIDLGALYGPHGLVYVGGKTWFTAEGAKAIGSYDPVKRKVDWIMGTGQNRTHMIWVSDDMQHIYTTNVASATVSILDKSTRTGPDFGGPPPGAGPGPGGVAPPPPPMPRGPRGAPAGNWDQTLIPVGKGGEGFDVSPDGKEIWVANAQDGTVSIIDIASKKVTATLPANYKGTNRLKFTPDGKLVLLSARTLVVLDAASHKEWKRLSDVGADAGIQIDPQGEKAYVSCNRDSYVAVIDLKTLQQIGKIDAGPQPDGLAWATQH